MLVGEHKLLTKATVIVKTAVPALDQPGKLVKAYETHWPIVVPRTMINAVLSVFHGDTSPLGHLGKHKTHGAMKTRFTWKGQLNSVRKWLGSCHKCLSRKRVVPKHQPYVVHESVRAPMNKIAIDIVGPLRRTERGNAYILTVYDTFSHWPSAYPLKSTKAKAIINCLKNHIAIHSVPATVLSDRGKNFMSKEVQHFLDQMGANKVATTPYKPTSNGSVERFHAYLGQSISHVVKRTHEDWDKHMDSILFAYRTTPLDGLNVTPFEIVYGRTPNLPIDNLLARDSCTEPIDTRNSTLQRLSRVASSYSPPGRVSADADLSATRGQTVK